MSLINMARNKVSKQFGVMLELEIKTLGFSKKVIEQ
jgi:UDP-N-acetylenolpyruvoylglucosamine reductase